MLKKDHVQQFAGDWQEIAQEASKETDSEKLMGLLEELNRALNIRVTVRPYEQGKKIA